jgi:hypothetical protein
MPNSIANHIDLYGASWSSLSACNSTATQPPLVVGPGSTLAGYLTLNLAHPMAITDPTVLRNLQSICSAP